MNYFIFKFITIVSMYFAEAKAEELKQIKWHTENRFLVECDFVGPLQEGQKRDCATFKFSR